MPKIYSIHDAKTNLSRLIDRACGGEEVVIARRYEQAGPPAAGQRTPELVWL
jgi:antitoxin (DNA-binding transcriptional repressor) of toxin-antitoxin stability system